MVPRPGLWWVSRFAMGQEPVLWVEAVDIPSLSVFPVFLLVGALAGVLGVAFNRGLVGSLNLFDRTKTWPAWMVGLIVGLTVGSLLGLAVGLLAQQYYPVAIEHPGVFGVVAMAAFFTAVVRAPLTAIILIIGNDQQLFTDAAAAWGLFDSIHGSRRDEGSADL